MMNTQLPILNAVSSANALPSPVSAQSAHAETSFNNVLNKEVNNRKAESSASTPSNTAKVATTNATNQPQAPKNDKESKTDDQTADKSQEAAEAAAPGASIEKSKKSLAGEVKRDHKLARQDEDHETSNAASAQMLALVSNVGQMNNHRPLASTEHTVAGNSHDKKLIGAIGVGAAVTDKFSDMKNENQAGGKVNPLRLDDLQDKAPVGKDILDGKSATALRAANEKTLPEPLTDKVAVANVQDKDLALTGLNAKIAIDPHAKPAETAQQPNSLVLAPALQQTMSLNQQAAATGQPSERLTPTVGSPGWDQAVGQKVVWMASGGLQSASLTLNPPDLGPLQVVLHVHNDQAEATFITAQPEVKQALEAAMPKLREMMDQAGIQLGQATVNTGQPNQQGSQQQLASGRRGSVGGDGKDDDELKVSTIAVRPAANNNRGLVDTFV